MKIFLLLATMFITSNLFAGEDLVIQLEEGKSTHEVTIYIEIAPHPVLSCAKTKPCVKFHKCRHFIRRRWM